MERRCHFQQTPISSCWCHLSRRLGESSFHISHKAALTTVNRPWQQPHTPHAVGSSRVFFFLFSRHQSCRRFRFVWVSAQFLWMVTCALSSVSHTLTHLAGFTAHDVSAPFTEISSWKWTLPYKSTEKYAWQRTENMQAAANHNQDRMKRLKASVMSTDNCS